MLKIALSSKIYFDAIKTEPLEKRKTPRMGRKKGSTLGFCMQIGCCASGMQFATFFFFHGKVATELQVQWFVAQLS